jgi:hypothetical protein
MSIDVSLVLLLFFGKGHPIADMLDQLSPVIDVGSYDGMMGEKQSPYKLLVSSKSKISSLPAVDHARALFAIDSKSFPTRKPRISSGFTVTAGLGQTRFCSKPGRRGNRPQRLLWYIRERRLRS